MLLLAAGRGRRFGSDKRYAGLPDGNTLLQASLQTIRQAELPVQVCLRPGDEALAQALLAPGVTTQICANAVQGMGATLAEGMTHVPIHWQAVLVALADMPWIQAQTFRAVSRQLQSSDLVIPCYQGRRGHPVGFRQPLFAELAALGGDAGARGIVRAHAPELCELELDDPGVSRDVDTSADLV